MNERSHKIISLLKEIKEHLSQTRNVVNEDVSKNILNAEIEILHAIQKIKEKR